MAVRTCSVVGCVNVHYAHGLCQMHGRRVKVRGTTDPKPITGKYVAVFLPDGTRDWEHRIIASRVLGKPLPPKAHVHHVDEDGRNNANDNLVICQDLNYHHLLHKRKRIREAGGNPNTDSWCSVCKTVRPASMFWTRKTGPRKGTLTTTCKLCPTPAMKARMNVSGTQNLQTV